jgi:hypothetical protein
VENIAPVDCKNSELYERKPQINKGRFLKVNHLIRKVMGLIETNG